jgi:hypothetical protein
MVISEIQIWIWIPAPVVLESEFKILAGSVADPGSLSRIRIFPFRIQEQKYSGSALNNKYF